MEFFILLIAFLIGWKFREIVAEVKLKYLLEKLNQDTVEELEELVRIKIEIYDGLLFAYHEENSLFIAQADSKEELEQKLAEKFPGKKFGCTTKNLKEVGFIS